MQKNSINFFTEGLNFTLNKKTQYIKNIKQCIKSEDYKTGCISFIFCSDNYLLELNKKYLGKDYYTDVLSFDFSNKKEINADIYISIERIKDNATKRKISVEIEIKRIIIHGILHLMGYNDKKESERNQMKKKEEFYLSLWI